MDTADPKYKDVWDSLIFYVKTPIQPYDDRPSRGRNSCDLVHLLMNRVARDSYREHSQARNDSPGFKDIPQEVWNNWPLNTRIQVRLERLEAWIKDYEPSPNAVWTKSPYYMLKSK